MFIVHVYVKVKPEMVAAFRHATVLNASESVREAGIARFDVLQQHDDPTCFILAEAYRTPEAQAAHRATAHYLAWRDAVAPMMAEPRRSANFGNIHPEDAAW
jgi:(4S)-4-hydroxy-5-phosphonooxypentane-2,3-dione isomerase